MLKHSICLLPMWIVLVTGASAQRTNSAEGSQNLITLSNGQYPEVFENDTLRRVGRVWYDRVRGRIVAIEPRIAMDTTSSSSLHDQSLWGLPSRTRGDSLILPECWPGRWLSLDPLMQKFPEESPYDFAFNNPVRLIDQDGKEPIKRQAGTIAGFVAVLNASPSKVGAATGAEAAHQLRRMGTTQFDWNQMRPLPTVTPYFNLKPSRYIYTEKGGWIDMVHFMFYAGKAYDNKVRQEEAVAHKQHMAKGMGEATEMEVAIGPPKTRRMTRT